MIIKINKNIVLCAVSLLCTAIFTANAQVGTWHSSVDNHTPYHLKNLRHTLDDKGSLDKLYATEIEPYSKHLIAAFDTNYLGKLEQNLEFDIINDKDEIIGKCMFHAGIDGYNADPNSAGSNCTLAGLYVTPMVAYNHKPYEVTYIVSYHKGINRLYIFGDSLSDIGNTYYMEIHNIPLSPPYYAGHFTDHYVWHEYLVDMMGLQPAAIINYAFGGARAIKNYIPVPSLTEQTNAYFRNNTTADPFALYSLWIGGNDFILGYEGDHKILVDEVTSKIIEEAERLIKHGAQNVLMASLPDLGDTPRATEKDEQHHNHNFSENMHEISSMFQEKLYNKVLELRTRHPDRKIIFIKALDVEKEILNHPEKYNILYTTGRCNPNKYMEYTVKTCNNPDQYLFWDEIHPSSHTHSILAKFVYDELIKEGFNFEVHAGIKSSSFIQMPTAATTNDASSQGNVQHLVDNRQKVHGKIDAEQFLY